VDGSRSCAELAIVHHLRAGGWDGVWVNAFRGELRTQWFPAPAARRVAEAGAPGWAAEIFEYLRAANGGTLSGFFDVFAWREPGRAAFVEAKVGPDRIKPTQLRFAEIALRFRPPARDRRGPACNEAAGDYRAALRRPGPAASAALAGPGRAWSWHLSGAAAPAHGAVDRGRCDQGGRLIRR